MKRLGEYRFTIFYSILFLASAYFLYTYDERTEDFLSNQEFIKDVMVEAWGLVGDLFVFGILFSIFSRWYERRELRKRYQDEIDTFKTWESREGSVFFHNALKGLNRLGFKEFDLRDANLSARLGAIDKAEFINVDFVKSNFSSSKVYDFRKIENCIFSHCQFNNAELYGTPYHDNKFTNCSFLNTTLYFRKVEKDEKPDTIYTTDFLNNSLKKCDFRGANLKKVFFKECQLYDLKFGSFYDKRNWIETDLDGVILTKPYYKNFIGLKRYFKSEKKLLKTICSKKSLEWLKENYRVEHKIEGNEFTFHKI